MTTFLQWLAAEIEQRTKPRPMCESEAIAWLIQNRNATGLMPSRSDVARVAGVCRHRLRRDKWPRFHATYERLLKLKGERS
jgi:hypothetical protein